MSETTTTQYPIEKSDLTPVSISQEQALESALVFPTSGVAIEKTGDDLVVIASTPHELVAAQSAVIERMKEKLAEAEEDERQAMLVKTSLADAGMAVTTAAERGLKRAGQRVRFLRKTVDALQAGYVIVPNFPGETIAVRVKRESPRSRAGSSVWGRRSALRDVGVEEPQDLPTGEGRYVDPNPVCDVTSENVTEKDREVTRTTATPIDLDEEIGLPAVFLKPTIIQRTGKVLARRIFDEIAVVNMPEQRGRLQSVSVGGAGDPMVIGRLIDRSRGENLRDAVVVSFLVAWFVDTKAI